MPRSVQEKIARWIEGGEAGLFWHGPPLSQLSDEELQETIKTLQDLELQGAILLNFLRKSVN